MGKSLEMKFETSSPQVTENWEQAFHKEKLKVTTVEIYSSPREKS